MKNEDEEIKETARYKLESLAVKLRYLYSYQPCLLMVLQNGISHKLDQVSMVEGVPIQLA